MKENGDETWGSPFSGMPAPVLFTIPGKVTSGPQYPPPHPAEPQQRLSLSHQAAPHSDLLNPAGDILVEVAVTAALLAVGPLGAGRA